MGINTINGHTFTLQELFDRSSYDIDYYQREFAWSTDDVAGAENLIRPGQSRLDRRD